MTEVFDESAGFIAWRERHDPRYLARSVFDLVVDSVPIVCVDFLPVSNSWPEPRLGIITRATGPEAGKTALLGGRIQKDETISEAIGRHLFESLGEERFAYYPGNSEDRPFYVAQYAHAQESVGGYDPTKHSIALTYLIRIANNQPEVVRDEASDFRWIGFDEIPDKSAYNHHKVMGEAVMFLKKSKLTNSQLGARLDD